MTDTDPGHSVWPVWPHWDDTPDDLGDDDRAADQAPVRFGQILNNTAGTHMANAGMAANVYEGHVTATVGSGREVMLNAGQNASSAAQTFEQRVTPAETGTH